MNKIAPVAELEKASATPRPDADPESWPEARATHPAKHHGWLSRLRSYFIFDPLIWAYTLILGTLSLICSFFDRDGRIQHKFARLWSWLVMKTILSPVRVTGFDINNKENNFDSSRPRVYAVTHASALDIPILYVHLPFQFRHHLQERIARHIHL